jgi:hypothetical protein
MMPPILAPMAQQPQIISAPSIPRERPPDWMPVTSPEVYRLSGPPPRRTQPSESLAQIPLDDYSMVDFPIL